MNLEIFRVCVKMLIVLNYFSFSFKIHFLDSSVKRIVLCNVLITKYNTKHSKKSRKLLDNCIEQGHLSSVNDNTK